MYNGQMIVLLRLTPGQAPSDQTIWRRKNGCTRHDALICQFFANVSGFHMRNHNSEVLNVISITLNNEVKIHNQLNEKSSKWLLKRSLSPSIDLDDFFLTLEATV